MNDTASSRNRGSWLRFMAGCSVFPIGLVALAFVIQGRAKAENTATELMTPVAIVWWVSFVLAIQFWRSRELRTAYTLLGVSIFMYLTCTPMVARHFLRSLESRVQSTNLSRENPLDAIVVLGGGTTEAPDGRAQLAHAGDRVGFAAQLYHQGIVKRIIVTGGGVKRLEHRSQNDPSIQAKRILTGMGIPESAIEELPGLNTSQEMQELKTRTDLWQGKQCGLLTSAFHMPRALGLATANGVEVVPVVADYRVLREPFSFRDLIPCARGAIQADLAVREYLGMLLGR